MFTVDTARQSPRPIIFGRRQTENCTRAELVRSD